MDTNRLVHALGAACLALLVAACGGGGGGDGDPNPPPTPPSPPPAGGYNLASALQTLFTANRSWSAAGRASDGNDYQTLVEYQVQTAGAFPRTGVVASRVLQQFTVAGGGSTSFLASMIHFDAAQVLGITALYGCSTVTMGPALPAGAAVGTRGTWYTTVDHDSCASQQQIGRHVVDWSVQTEDGYNFLCLDSRRTDIAGALVVQREDCIQLNSDHTLGTKNRVTLTTPTLTLVARN